MRFSIYKYGDDYYNNSIFCIFNSIFKRISLSMNKRKQIRDDTFEDIIFYEVKVDGLFKRDNDSSTMMDDEVYTHLKWRNI